MQLPEARERDARAPAAAVSRTRARSPPPPESGARSTASWRCSRRRATSSSVGARHGGACRRSTVASTRSRARFRRARRSRTARSRRGSARPARRAPSARRSGEIRSRSSCRATACSPRAARWAASPPTAASRRSSACWRSKAARINEQPRPLRRRRHASVSIRASRSRICAACRPGACARHRRRRRLSSWSSRRTPSIFGALAEAIVYQQLTGKAAATIFTRVCALFPRAHARPDAGADPARLGRQAPRRRPLAREAPRAARPRSPKRETGEIPTLAEARRMDDDAIIERLTEVRGIGRWTVEMLLIFRLGRPDVLPADDYGIRKGFAIAFKKRELPRGRPSRNAARGGPRTGRWRAGICGARRSWRGSSRPSRAAYRRPGRRGAPGWAIRRKSGIALAGYEKGRLAGAAPAATR